MVDANSRLSSLDQEKRRALLDRLQARLSQGSSTGLITPRSPSDLVPLSNAQQRLWFLDQLAPGNPAYNIPLALHLSGSLDTEALAKALNEIVRRHEVLRTSFVMVDGSPMQQIASELVIPLRTKDMRTLPANEREQAALDLAIEEARLAFNLSQGPVMRALLFQLADEEQLLLLVKHHIAGDDWSIGIMMKELEALYNAHVRGQEPALPPMPIQYADYAVWQQQWLQSDQFQKQIAYWKEQLEGAPGVLELPADRPRPATQTFRGALTGRVLPADLMAQVNAFQRQEGVTLYMTLIAAFQTLLFRYTGQEDIVIGSGFANRNHPEVERLIGFFVNALPMRTDLSGNPTFRTLLQQVRKATLEAHENQDLPFEKLVEALHPNRDPGRAPLFQVSLTLQNTPLQPPDLIGLQARFVEIDSGVSKFDLSLNITERPDGLIISAEYSTDLFDVDRIDRMLAHLQVVLEAAVGNPEQRLSDLPLLTPAEHHQMLSEWNQTYREYPHRTVQDLFEEQVERTPDAIAAVFEEQRLTYRELNAMANRLAHYLRGQGVRPQVTIGICINRSIEMLAAVLGVLKAGGAYVPLDPTYPSERLAFMLEDTQTKLVLTERQLLERLPTDRVQTLCLDESWPDGPEENLAEGAGPEHLIYVIYTSGSTGRPKGVLIQHLPVTQYVTGIIELFGITGADRILQFASLGFDVSVLEIFTALLSGASIHLVSRETLVAPDKLVRLLREQRITILVPAPAMLALLPSENLPDLRILYVGGESYAGELVNRWMVGHQFYAGYGPTEATIVVVTAECKGTYKSSPPMGRILYNHQAYVLDAHLNPLPVGVPGELHIGGVGVAWGYLNRPDLTAEKFIPDPFGTEPGARLYKTGDLVRYLPDGLLEFVGRIDKQIKLRGFRIELGEIEALLGQHPAVRQVVVMLREDLPGGKGLVAYVVADATASELRNFVSEHLPPYMVPTAFVMMESMPLLPSGKFNMRALPAPSLDRSGLEEGYVAPRTPLEEQVAAVFAGVLGVQRAGVHDSFFELGGNSLQAVQVVSRLRDVLGAEVSLQTLFEAATVSGIAERLAQSHQEESAAAQTPILPRTAALSPLPLSSAQQRLWFLDQFAPDSPLYNIPFAMGMSGPLHVAALEYALGEIVQRHEVLRTSFAAVDGNPIQVIAPSLHIPLPVVDLRQHPAETRQEEMLRLATEEARRPFDLAKGPVMRALLLRLENEEHILVMNMHHIASDGWSAGVLLRELEALYVAYAQEREPSLPFLPIQYADYALWQREWLSGEVLERLVQYWKSRLGDAPRVLELPADRPRPSTPSFQGKVLERLMPLELAAALNALGRQEGATLFMTMLAAFQVLLMRYTGQEDLVVGGAFAGRNRTEIENLIGFFVNMLVLRTDLSGNPTFLELLQRVRVTTLEAHEHQDMPFEKLVEALQPDRDPSRAPLFQVSITVQNQSIEPPALPNLQTRLMEFDAGVSRFDLSLNVTETAAGLLVSAEYSTDLFDEVRIDRMLQHLQRLLEGAVVNPQMRLWELPLLGPVEQHEIAIAWNDNQRAYPDQPLHVLFQEQVERTPDSVALVFAKERWTYRELNQRANRLAHALQGMKIGSGDMVGICINRSPAMIAGVLGIIKAGAAYVPLDPTYPTERLTFMLEDTEAPVLLTERALAERFAEYQGRMLCLDEGWPEGPEQNPVSGAGSENLAYVIYTSGSTGKPKGVLIGHRSASQFIVSTAAYFEVTPADRVLQFASLGFDVSVFEIFTALLTGATLVLGSREQLLSPDGLTQLMLEEGVTITDLPPAMMALLQADAFSAQRIVFVGGEAFPAELVNRWNLPGRRFFNGYGPTESTVTVTVEECSGFYTSSPPIGRAMANHQAYLLDQHANLVPMGIPGELHIGGVGLAWGYLKRPELTAEKFIPHPFSSEPGARLYKTGDLGRYLPNGSIEFLGRIDKQVKIRGFRIELGEIETALSRHPAVKQAAVMVRDDLPGGRGLIAYVVADTSSAELRNFISAELPAHMIPSAFVFMEGLPLTTSGKIDFRSLPKPNLDRSELEEAYVAPRTPLEEQVAATFASVLGIGRAGAYDHFFDLGGNSLQAIQLISRLREALRMEIPLQTLFEMPTVASLSQALESRRAPAEAAVSLDEQLRLLEEIENLSEEEVQRLLEAQEAAGEDE